MVQAMVTAVPDPAEILLRRRDYRVDPVPLRREPLRERPGPPELRALTHQEGGSVIQGFLGLGSKVREDDQDYLIIMIFVQVLQETQGVPDHRLHLRGEDAAPLGEQDRHLQVCPRPAPAGETVPSLLSKIVLT